MTFSSWTTSEGLPGNHITAILTARNGFLWVGTRSGLCRFDGSVFVRYTPSLLPQIPHDSVRALAEDLDGAIWVATKRGVVRLHEQGHRVFTTADGLSDDSTSDLAISPGGSAWIASLFGLHRITNGQVEGYTNLPPNHDYVRRLAIASEDQVFAGTDQGLLHLDRQRATFEEIWRAPGIHGDLHPPVVEALCLDPSGRLWIGGDFGLYARVNGVIQAWGEDHGVPPGPVAHVSSDSTGGVRVIAGNRPVYLAPGAARFVQSPIARTTAGGPTCVVSDGADGFWVGTARRGLIHCRPRPANVVLTGDGQLHEQAWAASPSRSGGLWVAHEEGIGRVRGDLVANWIPAGTPGPSSLRTLAELPDGTLLIASAEEHLFRFWPGQKRWQVMPQWSADPQCSVIYPAPDGRLWVGSHSGLSCLEPNPGSRPRDRPPVAADVQSAPSSGDFLEDPQVTVFRPGEVQVRRRDVTWIRRNDAWILRRGAEEDVVPTPQVPSWLGSVPHGLPQDLPPAPDVRVLLQDRRGVLWVGTAEAGLFALEEGLWTRVADAETLGTSTVWSLFEDLDGNLWIGTARGLFVLRDGRLTGLNQRVELPNSGVFQILSDHRDALWLATNLGLYCVLRPSALAACENPDRSIAATVLDALDGWPSAEAADGFQPAGCATASNGLLWFPTSHGLVRVEVALLKPPTQGPPVHIESLYYRPKQPRAGPEAGPTADEGPRGATDSAALEPSLGLAVRGQPPPLRSPNGALILPPGSGHHLSIAFAAPVYDSRGGQRYAYRLVGRHDTWASTGSRREAVFSQLDPGTYRFEVRAANRWNLWSPAPATLEFVIQPHFYQTPVFLAAIVLVGGLAVGALHSRRVRRIRELEALRLATRMADQRMRIARDLHDDLGGSLARVSHALELARHHETDTTKRDRLLAHVQGLTHEAGLILSRFIWSTTPRHDTVIGLVRYLSQYLEEVLQPTPMTLRLDIPAHVPDRPLSAHQRSELFLVCKEALTNILRHAGASEVRFRFVPDDQQLHLEIIDNGIGLPPTLASLATPSPDSEISFRPRAPRRGRGLSNMRRRVADLGGTLQAASQSPTGTCIAIQIPYARLARDY